MLDKVVKFSRSWVKVKVTARSNISMNYCGGRRHQQRRLTVSIIYNLLLFTQLPSQDVFWSHQIIFIMQSHQQQHRNTERWKCSTWHVRETRHCRIFYRILHYLRQVNEVNGGDIVFVRCVCVCVQSVCAADRSIKPRLKRELNAKR